MAQCDVTKMVSHGPKLRVIDLSHRPESVIDILVSLSEFLVFPEILVLWGSCI